MILQPELSFDAPSHTYTVLGKVVPSVSQVLRAGGGGADYSSVPPEILQRAADIGIEVHQCVEDYFRHGTMPATDDRSVEAYLPGLYDFIDDKAFTWLHSELLMYHPVLWYAGTVDLIGWVHGELAIVDVKTTNKIHRDAVELQTAAYAELHRFCSGKGPYKRWVLWLRKHKTYELIELDDPFSFPRFQQMLAA